MLLTLALLAQLLIPTKTEKLISPPPPQVEHTPRPGRIALKWHTLTLVGTAPTNGDNDGYADADETLDITLTLINKTGMNLTDVVATLSSADPAVACIGTAQVTVSAVAAGATFTTPAFRFKVADSSIVNRTGVDQVLDAHFDVAIRASQFDLLDRPMRFVLPLDFDAGANGGLGTWLEDFETPGSLGKFVLETLDAGKNSIALSDGMRCQYNDPDAPNSQSSTNAFCFLGFAGDPAEGVNDWHVHQTPGNGGVGRAYTGSQSLHWGVHLSATPKRDTGRFKQLDAVRSFVINVPSASVHPELSFFHQVSLVDNRGIGSIDNGEAADRAVVQAALVAPNGIDTGPWKNLEPYLNRYDQRGTDDYENCTFDPTDDGNTEDDYFDPLDPDRRTGPSSTCIDQFVFARGGDTDYRFPADPSKIGLAGDGPGLAGSINVGTWVQPVFNLQEFAGRRIKIRFVGTSLELGLSQTWDAYFGRDDQPQDDGWYIDAVRVSPVANLAVAIAPDADTITALPCGQCSSINAALSAVPSSIPVPGDVSTLDAGASTLNACLTGPTEYQFWVDANLNGIAGDAGDTLVRDFSDDPSVLVAPDATTQYAVIVACPTEPACDAADGSNTAVASVSVTCPPGIDRGPFTQTIRVDRAFFFPYYGTEIYWPAAKPVNWIKGCLTGTCGTTLKGAGTFMGTVLNCAAESAAVDFVIDDFGEPQAWFGSDYYYLVRSQSFGCGASGPGYSENVASEAFGRDAEIDADPVAMTCP